MIGPSIALRYALGRLRVADVERKLSSMVRLTVRGYRSRYPELAMDVDKQGDLAVVEEWLRARG